MARRTIQRRNTTGGVRAPSAPSAPSAAPRTAYGRVSTAGPNLGARVNAQGQPFRTQKAPGGVFHVYPDGRKVFVRAQPAKPATDSAASAAAAQNAGQVSGDEEFAPDAEYGAELAQQQLARTQRLAQLTEEGATDQTNYAEALRRFRENLPRQRRAALEEHNAAGLAQSTRHSERQTDIQVNNARQETDMTGAFQARERARAEARRALEDGATVEEAAARAEAIERQFARIADRAEEGSYAPNTPAAATAAAAAAPSVDRPAAKPAVKTRVVRGKVYRVTGNNKPVYVRRATAATTKRVNRRYRRR